MKITKLEIRSFRGIRDLSITVPPEGAIVAGGNAKGKSSVLKALTAAIAGQGIGADAIRLGADKAEIFVDLDAIRVKRSITKAGSTLTVRNADGDAWSKPQTRLNEIFGTAGLDALSFFLAEPKERRKLVMEALPVTVTAEDVARWAPGATKIAGRVSLDGHGLEVLERLHKEFYTVRSDVNRAAKTAREEARAALGFPPGPDDALTVDEAAKANAEAGQALVELQARDGAAKKAREAGASSRARIEDLRGRASRAAADAQKSPPQADIDDAAQVVADMNTEHERMMAQAKALTAMIKAAEEALEDLQKARVDAETSARLAADLDGQATEVEVSLAGLDAMAVPEEDLAAARAALAKTVTALEDASAAAVARAAQEHADNLAARATKIEADAAQVDEIVRRLATEAPQELAQRSALIPGLGIDGDTITLDGVSIDSLSGAEQMRFAVDLCRRLNASCKIIVVDGLERLDDDALEDFVKFATADGFQLIGTRVSKGELVVEAISADAKEAA